MSRGDEEAFARVDALLDTVREGLLPAPAERVRLRKAAGLSQQEVADVVGVRTRMAVGLWEAGEREPRAPHRAAYAHLLRELARQLDGTDAVPAPAPAPASAPAPVPAPASAVRPAPVRGADRRTSAVPPTGARPTAARGTKRRASGGSAAPETAPGPSGEDRFRDGPLAVLEGDGTAHCVGGQLLACPATSVVELVEWVLEETHLGAMRLHRHGSDSDPLVVLTHEAMARLGLPPTAPDVPDAAGGPRLRRLPDDHPVLAELADADWQLTRRGFGPWARVYRPATGDRRHCVQLCLPAWGALEDRAWGGAVAGGGVPAPELARVLGAYASRVITPRGSTAVAGLELMTALRPPTRPVRAQSGGWTSGPVPGSLTAPVDPAPPEAPYGHPLVGDREEDPATVVWEEAYDWARDPETLTDAECVLPYAVGLDVNAAFLAAANRLPVGLGAPEHVTEPAFDKRTPGCWRIDLSHAETDPRLPSPFTPDGTRPAGPAWYATPTLAYAAELGFPVRPLEAWVRPDSGSYLDPWYARLRDAYSTTMAALGVTAGMTPQQFLTATEDGLHKTTDPGEAAVLDAIKATVKGGLGKLRERAAGRGWRPGQPWAALERPTWRPDIRAAVIAQARTGMHRKMRRMAEYGLYPLGVLSDCVVYPSPGPSPLDVLPVGEDGAPLTKGVFVLGPNPGRVKHEGTQSLLWAAEMLDTGGNPARHIKGGDAVIEGGE